MLIMSGIFKKLKNLSYRLGNMNDKIPMFNSYNRYKDKCLKVLNNALEWNIKNLPNNTLDLQIEKIGKNIDDVINAENYQKQVEKLTDVLISIGGVARFDEEKAVDIFNEFVISLDRFIFMDVIDYVEQKFKMLFQNVN